MYLYVQVSSVVVLVGAAPDLEFLETDTQLGQVPGNPIDKNNPIDIGRALVIAKPYHDQINILTARRSL
jgi:hypothetical protein